MATIFDTPPLWRVESTLNVGAGKVTFHHNEPLSGGKASLAYDILAVLSELDILLEKELIDASVSTGRGHAWSADSEKDGMMRSAETLVATLEPRSTLTAYMSKNNLYDMFPNVASRLGYDVEQRDDVYNISDYFAQVAQINQIMSLCTQLRNDLNAESQKYYAHQIALLYQAVVAFGSQFSTFKKSIEGQFDGIKEVTERKETARLTDAQKAWVLEITTELQETIAKFPKAITKRMQGVRQYVIDHPTR